MYDISTLPATLLEAILDLPDSINSKTIITVRCRCGTTKRINFRSFWRKWATKDEYLCKSCHVKTYSSAVARVIKFQESFAKTSQTKEHKAKCSAAGKKAWENEETRQRIIEAVRQDNKTNPKKKIARDIARAALRQKPWFMQHMVEMRANQLKTGVSILESVITKILDELGVSYETQFRLGYYSYDVKIDNKLIEIQGEYWHRHTTEKDSAKATYASNAGYEIHHIWEHEFSSLGKIRDKIMRWLGAIDTQTDFRFDEITLSEITTNDARIFLGAYHYLPAISKSGWHIGAFHKNKLIATITFSAIVRKESATRLNLKSNQIKELSRFCIHPTYHKKNFASWLLSRSTKLFKKKFPQAKFLISFADETFGHIGTIYKAANWQYDGEVAPSYCYISTDGYLAHKKTIWDRARKLNMSESEYITRSKYKRICTKKKHRYLLRLE